MIQKLIAYTLLWAFGLQTLFPFYAWACFDKTLDFCAKVRSAPVPGQRDPDIILNKCDLTLTLYQKGEQTFNKEILYKDLEENPPHTFKVQISDLGTLTLFGDGCLELEGLSKLSPLKGIGFDLPYTLFLKNIEQSKVVVRSPVLEIRKGNSLIHNLVFEGGKDVPKARFDLGQRMGSSLFDYCISGHQDPFLGSGNYAPEGFLLVHDQARLDLGLFQGPNHLNVWVNGPVGRLSFMDHPKSELDLKGGILLLSGTLESNHGLSVKAHKIKNKGGIRVKAFKDAPKVVLDVQTYALENDNAFLADTLNFSCEEMVNKAESTIKDFEGKGTFFVAKDGENHGKIQVGRLILGNPKREKNSKEYSRFKNFGRLETSYLQTHLSNFENTEKGTVITKNGFFKGWDSLCFFSNYGRLEILDQAQFEKLTLETLLKGVSLHGQKVDLDVYGFINSGVMLVTDQQKKGDRNLWTIEGSLENKRILIVETGVNVQAGSVVNYGKMRLGITGQKSHINTQTYFDNKGQLEFQGSTYLQAGTFKTQGTLQSDDAYLSTVQADLKGVWSGNKTTLSAVDVRQEAVLHHNDLSVHTQDFTNRKTISANNFYASGSVYNDGHFNVRSSAFVDDHFSNSKNGNANVTNLHVGSFVSNDGNMKLQDSNLEKKTIFNEKNLLIQDSKLKDTTFNNTGNAYLQRNTIEKTAFNNDHNLVIKDSTVKNSTLANTGHTYLKQTKGSFDTITNSEPFSHLHLGGGNVLKVSDLDNQGTIHSSGEQRNLLYQTQQPKHSLEKPGLSVQFHTPYTKIGKVDVQEGDLHLKVTDPKLNGAQLIKKGLLHEAVSPYDTTLEFHHFKADGKTKNLTIPGQGDTTIKVDTGFNINKTNVKYEGSGLNIEAQTFGINKGSLKLTDPNSRLGIDAEKSITLKDGQLKAGGIEEYTQKYREIGKSKTISGEGGTLISAETIEGKAVVQEKTIQTYDGIRVQQTVHKPSHYSQGDVTFEASDRIRLQAPNIQGQNVTFDAPDTEITTVWEKNKTTTVKEEEGFFSSTSIHTQTTDLRAHELFLKAQDTITFKGDTAEVQGGTLRAQKLQNQIQYGLDLVPSVEKASYSQRVQTDQPLSSHERGQEGGQEMMAPVKLQVDQVVQDPGTELRMTSVKWNRSKTDILGPYRQSVYHPKSWQTTWCHSEQVIPDEALLVIALAASIATYGACGGLVSGLGITSEVGAAMAKAGFATLASQTTASFGRTGNPLQAFQAPFQKENLQALAINVATAGLMEKFGPPSTSALLKANKTPAFSDFVRYNGARTAFNTGLTMVVAGKPLERALKEGALQFFGNTLGEYGAYQIGQNYGSLNLNGTPKESGLSYGEHKVLHGVVGGLTGAILNASKSSKEIKQGVLSGATGAMAAEIAGEEILKQKLVTAVEEDIRKTGKIPSQQRIAELSLQAAKETKPWANVIGSSTGAFVGKDANTAYWAADNALENNFGVATPVLAALYYSPQLAQLCLRYGPEVVAKLVQQGISLIDLIHTVEKRSDEITGKLAKQEAGKQAPSTTGGPGLEPEKEPKKEGEREAERKIPPQTKSYIREIEKRTDTKISDTQKDHLAQDLRQNNYKKLEKPEYDAHARQFKGKKDDLISQWEQNTGQKWPTYEAKNPKTGILEPRKYDAHHINPQQLGGKHEWWNVYPVHPTQHQGGVHGSGSSLNQIVKELSKK